MNTYEHRVAFEAVEWKKNLMTDSGWFKGLTKKAQTKINHIIPERAHQVITKSIETAVKTALIGSQYTTSEKDVSHFTLEEKEKCIIEAMNKYRKTASVEGAGTGAGGILLGLADFPMLLTIKMKFLFETASLYGYDVKNYDERLFILHIFQLTYSSDTHRINTLDIIENWDERKEAIKDMNWRIFQQEYRDYIDLVKMLQLIPGFGAIVGAYANYNLMDRLGIYAMNVYRLRILKEV